SRSCAFRSTPRSSRLRSPSRPSGSPSSRRGWANYRPPCLRIARPLRYGLANVLHPRMLWLMVWPMLVSLAIWGTAAIVVWVRAAVWLAHLLKGWLDAAPFVARPDLMDR